MTTGSQGTISVWDLPTRLFHWGLVVLAIVLVVSGKTGRMDIHARAGEAALALVIFRLLWGIVGSRSARFADFLRGPAAILRYLRGAEPHRHPGHNPLGGWMVVVLLGAVLMQGLLGMFSNDDILFDGPLSHLVSKSTSDLATSVHETLFLLLCGLVAVHVAAVLVHWLVLKDNLLGPMLTGRKAGLHHHGVTFVGLGRAVIAAACAVALVWALLHLP